MPIYGTVCHTYAYISIYCQKTFGCNTSCLIEMFNKHIYELEESSVERHKDERKIRYNNNAKVIYKVLFLRFLCRLSRLTGYTAFYSLKKFFKNEFSLSF